MQYYSGVLYLTYVPKPPLSQFIELFWLYEGYTQPHAKERIMPDGSMQVIINLLENEIKTYHPHDPESFDRFSGAILAGPRSKFGIVDTASQRSLIGIHFKAGGASRFLKMPVNELENTDVSLECLWGIHGNDVRNRLQEAESPEAKILVLERCLMERAVKPFHRNPAVDHALQLINDGSPCQSVAGIAAKVGISRRRFIQVFSDEIGLTPKLFCRLHRFQRVLHAIHAVKDVDWVDIALAHGYFDQAHFNHEFRAFSGITPSAYLKHRTEHLNHVPLVD
ncbi:MAG TPA: helix-turn-helix domain-containing protein [Terriglobales bacterium]|nr:helix-turn-helix domain-containing protein [Terriglobales bacterium]